MNTRNFMNLMKVSLTAIFLWANSSYAAGLMTPKNGGLPELEIKEHHVNVVIENGYAVTSVEQIFYNPNATDLEAKYSFPIPEKAAVGEFTYWIDGQPVSAEVLEKKKAKHIYEEEKKAGREAAITEQDSYKTFDISVYPVRAQQNVRIKLTYIQPAHVDTSIGRYVYPLEAGGVDEQQLSFWTSNEDVREKFSFNLVFRSAYPVEQFRLPQHPQAATHKISDQEWSVSIVNSTEQLNSHEMNEEPAELTNQNTSLKPSVVQTLDKDIVVYWRHQSGLPGSVDMVTYREAGKDRGTFMMTVTPGDDLEKITEGRDWIFVLDYSGSMAGKYQSMVEGVNKGLHKLNPNDRFRIFTFSSSAQEITQDYVLATPENVTKAFGQLEQQRPKSSTNLYEGLTRGINVLNADRSSAIILVTDGVANVGTTEKKDFLNLMEKHDVRLFTFVMGNSANRPLLEGMTKISNGFAVNISNSDDIVGKLMEATSKLNHQAFHNVDVSFSGIKVKNLTPEKIGSLYRGQQLIVFGHYWGDHEKIEQKAKVVIKGKISGKEKSYTTDFDFPRNGAMHPELERLWAYAKIEDLQGTMDYFGENADTQQAITDIAVENGLVTNHTSMIVIRDEQFAQRNIERKNAKRIEKETAARAQRKAAPVQNNRVDQNKPAYTNSRPSYSNGGGNGGGGGSINPLLLLCFLPFAILARLRKVIKDKAKKDKK